MNMNLWRTDPFHRLMDDIFLFTDPQRTSVAARTDIEAEDTEEAHLVRFNVPGVDPKDLQVRLANPRTVEITGTGRKDYQYLYRFPQGLDSSAIEATYALGVLTVRIPKRAEEKPRVIEVKALGP